MSILSIIYPRSRHCYACGSTDLAPESLLARDLLIYPGKGATGMNPQDPEKTSPPIAGAAPQSAARTAGGRSAAGARAAPGCDRDRGDAHDTADERPR